MLVQSNPQSCYEVQKIIGKKIVGHAPFYLIKWKNYPICDATWEPKSSLEGLSQLRYQFQDKLKGSKLPYFQAQYFPILSNSQKDTNEPPLHKRRQKRGRILVKSQAKIQSSTISKQKLRNKIKENSIIICQLEDKQLTELKYQTTLNDQDSKSVHQAPVSLARPPGNNQIKRQKVKDPVNIGQVWVHVKEGSLDKETSFMKAKLWKKSLQFQRQTQQNQANQQKSRQPCSIRGMNEKVSQIKYQRRVQGKLLFDMQNLYRIIYHDGTLRYLKTSQIKTCHLDEFIRYLESQLR